MYHFFSKRIVNIGLAYALVSLAMPANAVTATVVPVEDLSAATPAVQAKTQKEIQQQNANAELFVMLESFQQELAQLRGQVEELSFKLRQMEQNQKDRYIDLDRRITNLNTQTAEAMAQTTASSANTQAVAAINTAPVTPAVVEAAKLESDPAQQQADYKAAFNLIRTKEFEQAITALLKFVDDYPNGTLTGNAHYWLGEVYMVERDPEAAILQFSIVINQFPEHRKVPDALYKTGRAWINLGDNIKGQRMLEQVVNAYPESSAARLARELRQ
jgi:tol-pal system protein YbgF